MAAGGLAAISQKYSEHWGVDQSIAVPWQRPKAQGLISQFHSPNAEDPTGRRMCSNRRQDAKAGYHTLVAGASQQCEVAGKAVRLHMRTAPAGTIAGTAIA